MTITMEETTTAASTYAALRAAARAALSPDDVVEMAAGMEFIVPAGYRAVNDTDYQTRMNRFLITGIEAEAEASRLTARESNMFLARWLGVATHTVVASSDGTHWYQRSNDSTPGAYVHGAHVQVGFPSPVPADRALICFDDGTVGRWHDDSAERAAGYSLRMVQSRDGRRPEREGVDFENRSWVYVEEVPSFTAPAGWEIRATDPAAFLATVGDTMERRREMRDLYLIHKEEEFRNLDRTIPDNQIKQGRLSSAENHWYFTEQGVGVYATAAVINPALEYGKHYLTEENTVVRCASHTGQRHGYDLDGNILSIPGRLVEVVRTAGAAEAEAAAPSGAGVVPFANTITPASPLLGLAADTAPELDPDPVAGSLYVAWDRQRWAEGDTSTLMQCAGEVDGEIRFIRLGIYRASDGEVRYERDSTADLLHITRLRAGYHWARAALSPVVHPSGTVQTSITDQLSVLEARRETYSDALNELAQENSWCSEFEDIVQPMGFPGRSEMAKDYSVTLHVDFSMTDHSPSSNMDRRVETEVFNDNVSSLSLTEMSFEGSLDFTMTVSEVKPTRGGDSLDSRIIEGIKENLSDASIESALEDLLPGSFNVGSWSVQGYEEDDN